MNPKKLTNNEELLEYMEWLVQELKRRGRSDLADKIAAAAEFACGSPSEFLNEAELSLRAVRNAAGNMLSDIEEETIDGVVSQIVSAFKAVGGG